MKAARSILNTVCAIGWAIVAVSFYETYREPLSAAQTVCAITAAGCVVVLCIRDALKPWTEGKAAE